MNKQKIKFAYFVKVTNVLNGDTRQTLTNVSYKNFNLELKTNFLVLTCKKGKITLIPLTNVTSLILDVNEEE